MAISVIWSIFSVSVSPRECWQACCEVAAANFIIVISINVLFQDLTANSCQLSIRLEKHFSSSIFLISFYRRVTEGRKKALQVNTLANCL